MMVKGDLECAVNGCQKLQTQGCQAIRVSGFGGSQEVEQPRVPKRHRN